MAGSEWLLVASCISDPILPTVTVPPFRCRIDSIRRIRSASPIFGISNLPACFTWSCRNGSYHHPTTATESSGVDADSDSLLDRRAYMASSVWYRLTLRWNVARTKSLASGWTPVAPSTAQCLSSRFSSDREFPIACRMSSRSARDTRAVMFALVSSGSMTFIAAGRIHNRFPSSSFFRSGGTLKSSECFARNAASIGDRDPYASDSISTCLLCHVSPHPACTSRPYRF